MGKRYKNTPVRKLMLRIFATQKEPFSVGKLNSIFESHAKKVNKTTLYREVDYFVKKGVIKELYINSSRKYYEPVSLKHHHHAICNSCGSVEDIYLKREVDSEQNELERKTGFKVVDHSLEFFGFCISCK